MIIYVNIRADCYFGSFSNWSFPLWIAITNWQLIGSNQTKMYPMMILDAWYNQIIWFIYTESNLVMSVLAKITIYSFHSIKMTSSRSALKLWYCHDGGLKIESSNRNRLLIRAYKGQVYFLLFLIQEWWCIKLRMVSLLQWRSVSLY